MTKRTEPKSDFREDPAQADAKTASKDNADLQPETVLTLSLEDIEAFADRFASPAPEWSRIDPAASGFTTNPQPNGDLLDTELTLTGTNGDDVLQGTNASEFIDMLLGDDLVIAGGGNDWVQGLAGDKVVYGDAGDDLIFTAAGTDQAFGGTGNDRISTGSGDDTAQGNDGDDELWGEDGSDDLSGNEGRDALFGGAANDLLSGGADIDFLMGGIGQDILSGGGDVDLFSWRSHEMLERDTITDFVLGEDLLHFSDGEGVSPFAMAPGETISDVLIALDVGDGTDLLAHVAGFGWSVFAHLDGVDATDMQAAIDDGSALYDPADAATLGIEDVFAFAT